MSTVNGNVGAIGIGNAKIKVSLLDSTFKVITFYNTHHIPSCPVNLFSGKKFLKALGGVIHKDKLLYQQRDARQDNYKEFCQIDKHLFIVKTCLKNVKSFQNYISLLAALQTVSCDIELQHRRMGHLSIDNVQKTKKVIQGINFIEKKSLNMLATVTKLCKPCKLGAPLQRVQKTAHHKAVNVFDCVQIDVFIIKPVGLKSHIYSALLMDEYT